MSDNLQEQIVREDWRVVDDIGNAVAQLLESSYRQSAKQDKGENDWCIWLGHHGQPVYGVACFTLDDRARAMGDNFIRELATQVLGYPPDSVQDLERRIADAQAQIDRAQAEIDDATKRRYDWTQKWVKLNVQLAKTEKVQS